MKHMAIIVGLVLAVGLYLTGWWVAPNNDDSAAVPAGRSEVLFWHFWGGADRDVVASVVERFNASQDQYFVRAVAMPGNNLQAKLFLSVAGGDPPDLVNQDDPVIPDWASRGVIQAMEDIASPDEVQAVRQWMLPAAERLSVFEDRMFGICNGLDVRALYYNQTMLDQYGLAPPKTLEDLDRIAEAIAPPGSKDPPQQYGYLPDTRRLWAWGYVFGGNFYDPATGRATVDSPQVISALEWMASYRDRYSADRMAAFRKGDQSLPGKSFPLLPVGDDQLAGRYAVIMDGQWRVRNLEAFQKRRRAMNLKAPEFGVCALPPPTMSGARHRAGWVNGNFFVIPRGASNPAGAWAFAKFWIGYQQTEQAAVTCAAGGWIPVSQTVTETPTFTAFLDRSPMFREFVDLAASPDQYPTPQVVGAAAFKRTVDAAAYQAVYGSLESPAELLGAANRQIQAQLDRR